MTKSRVIVRLDVKGPNLVKGIHLEGLRVLGDPAEYARHYYHEGADELFYMDVVASLYGRNNLLNLISKTARETFIPLTVGGGIRTVDDIQNVLRAGADKVCINTGAVKNPEFIRQAAERFGSSTIVTCIECIKQYDGDYLAYTDNGREETGLEVVAWAQRLESLGAGELVVTSVDREGTGQGMDLELISAISKAVSIPVVAHGGVGKPAHAVEAIKTGADAVAVASVFHYHSLRNEVVKREGDKNEGNTSFITNNKYFGKFSSNSIGELKKVLNDEGIPTRRLT